MPQLTDQEYLDWHLDTENDPYRVVLFELNHAAGMIGLASHPYHDGAIPYDDWLTGVPLIEESVTTDDALGDLQAINPLSVPVQVPAIHAYPNSGPTIDTPLQASALGGASQIFTVSKNESGVVFFDQLFRLVIGTTPGASDVFDSGWIDRTGVSTWSHVVTGLPVDGVLLHVTISYNEDSAGSAQQIDRIYEYLGYNAEQWSDKEWPGHDALALVGDLRWPREQFRVVGRNLIDSCLPEDGALHTFNLSPYTQALDRTFAIVEEEKVLGAKAAIEWVLSQLGMTNAVEFIDLPLWKETAVVRFDVAFTDTALAVINQIAASVFASIRFNPATAALEVVAFSYLGSGNANPVLLTEDDIVFGGVTPLDQWKPYNTIVTKYSQDRELIADNSALDNGSFNDSITIDTLLDQTAFAELVHAEYAALYSVPRTLYQLYVLFVQDIVSVGTSVRVVHSELNAVGVIKDIERALLSRFSTIEVLM